MTKKIFEKLNQSTNGTDGWNFCTGSRVQGTLDNASLTKFIHIYEAQENNGGYSKCYKSGLTKYRNFGKKSLEELESKLKNNGFPSLPEAPTVIREFKEYEQTHYTAEPEVFSDDLAKRIIEGVLVALGRKKDADTIQKVIDITAYSIHSI